MFLEMAGKLWTRARSFLATAYSGRAIRDAARSASQRRSPPGAGMEEAAALASCGICGSILFRWFVSVGFVLMRSGRSSWVGSDWVGSWWLQPAGIASDRGWWGGFNLHAMKILGSGPNGSGGSSWTRLGRAGTAQIGMLCMKRNRTESARVQSHQVQSELIGDKL